MKKINKIMAACSISAVMAMNFNMVSQAEQNGWIEEESGWYFYNNGEAETNTWKKGVDGFYYLDKDGRMISGNWIIGSEDKVNYVNSQGLRVKNEWRYLKFEGNTTANWYYFNDSGIMVKGKQMIGNNVYFFDEDGKMLTGWVFYEDGLAYAYSNEIDRDAGDFFYCLEDGTRVSGWKKLDAPHTQGDEDSVWYYFSSIGKMHKNTKSTISGSEYCFDETGKMLSGWVYRYSYINDTGTKKDLWVEITDSTSLDTLSEFKAEAGNLYAVNYYFCGNAEDGVMRKNDWIKTVPYDKLSDLDESTKWFYLGSDGRVTAATKNSSASNELKIAKVSGNGAYKLNNYDTVVLMKKINSMYYAFGTDGKLVEGLMYVLEDGSGSHFKKGFYCFSTNSARASGQITRSTDGIDASNKGVGYIIVKLNDESKLLIEKDMVVENAENSSFYKYVKIFDRNEWR